MSNIVELFFESSTEEIQDQPEFGVGIASQEELSHILLQQGPVPPASYLSPLAEVDDADSQT